MNRSRPSGDVALYNVSVHELATGAKLGTCDAMSRIALDGDEAVIKRYGLPSESPHARART